MFKKLLCTLAVLLAFVPNSEGIENESIAAFMGDSITEGWNKASAGHPDFFTSNNFLPFGISGQNTTQMLVRFESEVIAAKPRCVVILGGTNDIAGNGGVVTNDYILDNLCKMGEMAEAADIRVILCSILPTKHYWWRKELSPTEIVARIADMNVRIQALCKAKGWTYADYFSAMVNEADGGILEAYSDDAIHPNKAGYTVMEGIILPIVQKLSEEAWKEELREAPFMTNVYGRDYTLLNGKWSAFTDLYDQGRKMEVYKNRKARRDEEFFEYSFDGAMRLDVPGDWNSQYPELKYYEGTMWYARHFDAPSVKSGKTFLYFGAVSYRCRVYLNGEMIAEHEGGFTPFQIDVTGRLADKDNFLCVEVSNRRTPDAIPAMNFDWWNYGGITRDVMLVSVPEVYIKDYFIRLDRKQPDLIHVSVALSEDVQDECVIEIPELKLKKKLGVENGRAGASFKVKKLQRWAQETPKLYDVAVSCGSDRIEERIGFRNIDVEGEKILVNGEPVFMRSVSFHEEIAQRKGRAFSQADAAMLLSEAEALGVNMIRLAHYPQNEYTVRLAEEKGILLWEEIPIWQGIDFKDAGTRAKAQKMLSEMIHRDKNRCALGYWGVANETKPSAERNDFLKSLLDVGKSIDTSRLYVAAFDLVYFDENARLFRMDDGFTENLDVVAVNKYMGWYHPWPLAPSEAVWDVVRGQPLIVSEFGGEALYGQHGSDSAAHSWSEDYQARLYRDNLEMFNHIPNLAGVSPWVLFDFRSPYRFHPTNQDGWNRKGLVSDRGQRKAAWYIMHDWYAKKGEESENK